MSGAAKPKIVVTSLDIETVMTWSTTPYNLYLKLADGRFLAVLRKSNTIDKDRLQKYAVKGVKTLFASEQELVDAVGAEVIAAEVGKFEALEKVSQVVFDELRVLGVTEATFNHAKSIGKAVRGQIERNPQLADAFEKFQAFSREDVRHSLMVSALATVIASSMEWIKPATIENIAMGGLLHDFGKFMLPKEILEKAPLSLSENDRKILDGHAEAGRALLAQVKTIPEDIQMIVAQHHERSDGSGYPLGLKDFYIHPLARVVGLANELVERYEIEVKEGRKTTIRILVENLIGSQSSKFNRDLIKSLREMLESDTLQ